MADEGQTPRYSSTCSGSNQVVQETNQASSTQDNASEDPQIRPGVTPEAERPLLTTSACSSDTAQTGTSSAVILLESAGSEKVWADMLKDWYEKTIGNPQSAHGATGSTQREQRKDGVRGEVNHAKKPPGKRRPRCEICSKSFTSSSNLVRHRRIHTGEKPYRCDICANHFTREYNLATHRCTHSGEKPYKCATCAKSFAQSHNLREHERTHTGETPCKCEICGHSFMNRYFLRKHQLMHNDEDLRKLPPPQKKKDQNHFVK